MSEVPLYMSPGVCVAAWGGGKAPRSRLLFPDTGYRGTSLIRNTPPLGPYSKTLPRVIWWS